MFIKSIKPIYYSPLFFSELSLLILFIFGVLIILLIFRYSLGSFFLGDGIVSACRIRITAKDPPHRKPRAYEKATFTKRFKSVGRARRCEPACRVSFQGRQKFLIKANQPNANMLHIFYFFAAFAANISRERKANSSSRAISVLFLFTAATRALITTRNPFLRFER